MPAPPWPGPGGRGGAGGFVVLSFLCAAAGLIVTASSNTATDTAKPLLIILGGAGAVLGFLARQRGSGGAGFAGIVLGLVVLAIGVFA
jgi:hypothetical protein